MEAAEGSSGMRHGLQTDGHLAETIRTDRSVQPRSGLAI